MVVNITYPNAYQIFQRDPDETGDIHIIGTYSVGVESGTPQARFNGGAWTTLTSPVAGGGNFSGILSNQPTGQGTLEVRMSGTPATIDTKIFIGIGDIFVVAGQSNASGRGTTMQTYSRPPGYYAGNYKNNNLWAQLVDPFDSATGQVDTVSSDPTAGGSFMPRLAERFLAEVPGVPIGFIPCPLGGSAIDGVNGWQRVISSTRLYGSMWKRIRDGAHGKVKAVLWFQGESNSLTARATYAAALSQLANDIGVTDYPGVPLIPCLLPPHPSPDSSGNFRLGPRIGTLDAIESNALVLMGPAFYDVDTDADLHYETDAHLDMVGDRYWAAIKEHFYDGEAGSGWGPTLHVANYDAVENVINLQFDKDILDYPTADENTFVITDATAAVIATEEPCKTGDRTVRIPLLAVPSGDTDLMTISFGHNNRGGVNATVYSLNALPAVPAYQFACNGVVGG